MPTSNTDEDDPRPRLISALSGGDLAVIVRVVRECGELCVSLDTAEFGRSSDASAPLRAMGESPGRLQRTETNLSRFARAVVTEVGKGTASPKLAAADGADETGAAGDQGSAADEVSAGNEENAGVEFDVGCV